MQRSAGIASSNPSRDRLLEYAWLKRRCMSALSASPVILVNADDVKVASIRRQFRTSNAIVQLKCGRAQLG